VQPGAYSVWIGAEAGMPWEKDRSTIAFSRRRRSALDGEGAIHSAVRAVKRQVAPAAIRAIVVGRSNKRPGAFDNRAYSLINAVDGYGFAKDFIRARIPCAADMGHFGVSGADDD
jgi:hypothetical protein